MTTHFSNIDINGHSTLGSRGRFMDHWQFIPPVVNKPAWVLKLSLDYFAVSLIKNIKYVVYAYKYYSYWYYLKSLVLFQYSRGWPLLGWTGAVKLLSRAYWVLSPHLFFLLQKHIIINSSLSVFNFVYCCINVKPLKQTKRFWLGTYTVFLFLG